MKKVRNLLLAIICSAAALPALSQSPLRFEILPPGIDYFNVIKNGSFSFSVRLYNDDTVGFGGDVSFFYKIDTTTYTDTNSSTGLTYVSGYDTIPPGDSSDYLITVNSGEPRFKTGPSVVVIWPIITLNGLPLDTIGNSITIHVTVIDPSGIGKKEKEEKIEVFVWNNTLHLPAQNKVRRVRIYDILGRQLLDAPNPADNVPLPFSNGGVYIAEITYNNNQRYIFRFYR